MLAVAGAVAFGVLVLGSLRRRRSPDSAELIISARRRAAGIGLAFTLLLLITGAARLYAQSLAMHGADQVLDPERITTLLLRSVWGWGWLIQIGATLLLGAGFAVARRRGNFGWALASAAVLLLAVTPALSGHAAAMTGAIGTLAILVDALHVLAAGGWLGSLLVLLMAGIPEAVRLGPARRGPAVASLVHAYSPTALVFAGLLVLSGGAATVIHSSSIEALLASRYGTLLLIKLGIVLIVVAIGAYNFLRVRPALGDPEGTRVLRRTAAFELTIGAVVLVVTSMLVATARPYEEPGSVAAGRGAAVGVMTEASRSPAGP